DHRRPLLRGGEHEARNSISPPAGAGATSRSQAEGRTGGVLPETAGRSDGWHRVIPSHLEAGRTRVVCTGVLPSEAGILQEGRKWSCRRQGERERRGGMSFDKRVEFVL